MHDDPMPGRAADALGRGAEDAVLRRVLDLHPTHLGERELALDLIGAMLAPRCEAYERDPLEALRAEDDPRSW